MVLLRLVLFSRGQHSLRHTFQFFGMGTVKGYSKRGGQVYKSHCMNPNLYLSADTQIQNLVIECFNCKSRYKIKFLIKYARQVEMDATDLYEVGESIFLSQICVRLIF